MPAKTRAKPTTETKEEEEEDEDVEEEVIPINLFKLQEERYESAKSILKKYLLVSNSRTIFMWISLCEFSFFLKSFKTISSSLIKAKKRIE